MLGVRADEAVRRVRRVCACVRVCMRALFWCALSVRGAFWCVLVCVLVRVGAVVWCVWVR